MEKVDQITTLAKLFKERDNLTPFSPCVASLIQSNPVVLKISDTLFLSKEYENLMILKPLSIRLQTEQIKNVLVVPSGNGDMWYAVEEVI